MELKSKLKRMKQDWRKMEKKLYENHEYLGCLVKFAERRIKLAELEWEVDQQSAANRILNDDQFWTSDFYDYDLFLLSRPVRQQSID